jgi:hypothetical protein
LKPVTGKRLCAFRLRNPPPSVSVDRAEQIIC